MGAMWWPGVRSSPSQSLLRLLILLGVLGEAAIFERHRTLIDLSGNVTCPRWINKRWCFRIVLMEYDSFGVGHDRVQDYGVKCVDNGPEHEYFLPGSQYGDGFNDNEYEFFVWIYHNCTQASILSKQVHDLGTVSVSLDLYKRVQNFGLSDLSVRADSYFDDK
ncbi:hypothetical protein GCK72_000894 [Caenorhabditis remanei]|uniref:Uncharacterized protein n=1 Tax=Caenorhabditis remanei TaxID=31234 RepID=A0A6A5HPC8_CAERE|nr:hypothetical protein GCK72_000894 [Caenorhabditis remanei]KAF1769081.1 hypothetical protein GCK72_000894 [Caenorhabditis remanei]